MYFRSNLSDLKISNGLPDDILTTSHLPIVKSWGVKSLPENARQETRNIGHDIKRLIPIRNAASIHFCNSNTLVT